jgi:two-component system, OmpR family, KDP operon response regulator KdpE
MVEDDAATVEAVKLGLEIHLPALGFKAAGNGQEALQMLNQGDYDSVLVDLGLPDMDGIELIKQLRTFSQIPIVVLSARSSPEAVCQALKSGANEYIIKPFKYFSLLKVLTDQMHKVNL